ncbi:MAG TPA: Txe/YoeB family addiction module toxin [Candidatus Desulfaltia sp.]|nr:Txe/YoeB family addiction module toxin [Candidatus Desulfaltia sp.]
MSKGSRRPSPSAAGRSPGELGAGLHSASAEGRLEAGRGRLKDKAVELLKILEHNPYESPPPHEKLKGDLTGACSRRISVQHRHVYQIHDKQKTVKIIRLWTHYE